MKIVFLDVKSIGEDIDLSGYEQLGEVVRYPFSEPYEIPARAADADVLVLNKPQINAETIRGASRLKLVCVTGTGTDHLDKEYLKSRNITWKNVAGYSTESVAQHTFAMLFYLLNKLGYYNDYVKENRYTGDTSFTHFEEHFHELNGKTWGIIGLGSIGRRVASIAEAFGARIIYFSPSGSAPQQGYHQVDMDTLLAASDIISIHAPLNRYTRDLIGAEAFRRMKSSCIFLNLGRGSIVSEQALAEALVHDEIAAAGLDVLSREPIDPTNPLLKLKNSRKLLITPHVAWASVESRTRLMRMILDQIREFFSLTDRLP